MHFEPKYGGLEDDVPFQLGDFLGSMLIFKGVVVVSLGHFEKMWSPSYFD